MIAALYGLAADQLKSYDANDSILHCGPFNRVYSNDARTGLFSHHRHDEEVNWQGK
jgi:hypothetical protein